MEKNIFDLTFKELLIMFWNEEGAAKNAPTFEDFISSIWWDKREEIANMYNDHMKSKP